MTKKLQIFIVVLSALLSVCLVSPAFACDFRVYKFNDLNSNGVWDEGEPAIEGWEIRLYRQTLEGWQLEATGVTGSGGAVLFEDLWGDQTWRVWEAQDECWEPTTPPVTGPWVDGYYIETYAPSGSSLSFEFGNVYICDEEGCRVTAGGNKDGVYCPVLNNGEADPDYCLIDINGDITSTWGGQAGAPPRIDGNWTHKYLDRSVNPHNKFTFHSNELFYIECSDPGEFCQPARFAPNRQIDFAGIGRFTNKRGEFRDAPDGDLCFNVHLEDIGEPGPGGRWPNADEPCTHCPGTEIVEPDCTNCTDYYEIKIYDSADHNPDTGECLGELLWRNGNESENCVGSPDFVAPFAPYGGFFTRTGNVQIHPDNNGP